MRAAVLLSAAIIICGIAALFDVPAIYFNGKPVLGILGFATSLAYAAIPPLAVVAWRKMRSRSAGPGATSGVSPDTSLERRR